MPISYFRSVSSSRSNSGDGPTIWSGLSGGGIVFLKIRHLTFRAVMSGKSRPNSAVRCRLAYNFFRLVSRGNGTKRKVEYA